MVESRRRRAVPGVIGALLLVLAACGGGGPEDAAGDRAPTEARPPAEVPEAESQREPEPDAGEGDGEEPSVAPLVSRQVRVFFPSVYFDGLAPETHEIFETASPGDRAKQILVDLLAGPDSPSSLRAVPTGVRLRQVYWIENGTAWADFTGELVRGMRGGSMEEVLTVYAIVNSLALNVPEIKRVGILVDGKEIDTLSGHVDLRLPLLPDRRLLKRPASSGAGPRADRDPAGSVPAASVR